MVVWGSGTHQILEDGVLRPTAETWTPEVPRESGPFEIADFGSVDRFSWAAGACAVGGGKYSYWGQRFACSLNDDTLWVWDATRPLVAKLTVPGLFDESRYGREPRTLVGMLWTEKDHTVTSIELAQLEALFDHASGPLPIEVRETFPQRRPKARESADILELATKAMTVKIVDDQRILAVPRVEGAAVGMRIYLCDELAAGTFHAIELPGQPPRIVNELPLTERTIEARLVVEKAIDPANGPIIAGDRPSRQGDLDRLFNALADDPDDAATREILIDLLEDSGEPYATLLHELVAGNEDDQKRREALGTLANYLRFVEYHGGLWATALLYAQAPLDPAIGDAVAMDQRLGFLHTLRIAQGPFAVYAKLVGAPRAVGLRHVDVPNGQVLAALIAGKRTNLTQLSNVKFATRAVIDGLADPTFDRVVRLHTETSASIVAKQLQFFIRDEAGFFARAPRHLILTERDGFGDRLVQPVHDAWPKLPVVAITVGELTLTR